jgi:hypothetical protein
MTSLNRNEIESYYKEEWSNIISPSVCNILIEITCQQYQTGKLSRQTLTPQQQETRPQDLGQV